MTELPSSLQIDSLSFKTNPPQNSYTHHSDQLNHPSFYRQPQFKNYPDHSQSTKTIPRNHSTKNKFHQTLKLELQSLKSEVNKLMKKDKNFKNQETVNSNFVLKCEAALQKQKVEVNDQNNEELELENKMKNSKLASNIASLTESDLLGLQAENSSLKSQVINLNHQHQRKQLQQIQIIESLQTQNLTLQAKIQLHDIQHRLKPNLEIQKNTTQFMLELHLKNQAVSFEENSKQAHQLYEDNNTQNDILEQQIVVLQRKLNQKELFIANLIGENQILQQKINESEKEVTQLKMQMTASEKQIKDQESLGKEKHLGQLIQLSMQNEHLKASNQEQKHQSELLKHEVKGLQVQEIQLNQQIKDLASKHHHLIEQIANIEMAHQEELKKEIKKSEVKINQIHQKYLDLNEAITPRRIKPSSQPKELETITEMQREILKWKGQYKILKERHEERNKNQEAKKQSIDKYYKSYRENKQRNQILTEKNNLLEKSVEKYLEILLTKEKQFIKKEIQFNKFENQSKKQLISLQFINTNLESEKKIFEERLEEESLKFEKQMTLRKSLEEKILSLNLEWKEGNSKQFLKEGFQEVLERIRKRVSEQDEKMSKQVKEMKAKDNLILKLKNQVKEIIEKHQNASSTTPSLAKEKSIENIDKSFQFLQLQKEAVAESMAIYQVTQKKLINQNISLQKQVEILQKELRQLKNQYKNLVHLYNAKCEENIDGLKKKDEDIFSLQDSLEIVTQSIENRQKIYQLQLTAKQEQVQGLRDENRQYIKINCFSQHNSFDEVLKGQIQNGNQLRDELARKNEQIFKIRDQYQSIRSLYDNLKSESQILKLKQLSERKNMDLAFNIDRQNLMSQVSMSEKKFNTLEQKIQLIIEENKKKDSFIQNYIMNKKLPEKEIIIQMMKQLELKLDGPTLTQQIHLNFTEVEQHKSHNQTLMKEIVRMREKLLLYESMEQDNVSIYESQSKDELAPQFSEEINEFDTSPRSPKLWQKNQVIESPSKLKRFESLQNFQWKEAEKNQESLT